MIRDQGRSPREIGRWGRSRRSGTRDGSRDESVHQHIQFRLHRRLAKLHLIQRLLKLVDLAVKHSDVGHAVHCPRRKSNTNQSAGTCKRPWFESLRRYLSSRLPAAFFPFSIVAACIGGATLARSLSHALPGERSFGTSRTLLVLADSSPRARNSCSPWVRS